ncbi:MAG TPA: hypothetical protein EYP05_07855 [Piscirickettsiaceae bacterium]|nr:hypothetical protein [Piscirickettsiaceae bacterium]
MIGVTAGSALAVPIQKGPIKPDDAIGIGAYIKTTLYGHRAVVSEITIPLHPITFITKVRYYKVRHNELGGIAVAFYVPSNLKVWTSSLNGAHLINVEDKGRYKVITVETNSRFTSNIRMGITFNSGYGKHGILVIGHMSASVLQSYIMSLASAGGIIGGFVATGTTALLSEAIGMILTLASGASLDALIYEEV